MLMCPIYFYMNGAPYENVTKTPPPLFEKPCKSNVVYFCVIPNTTYAVTCAILIRV